MSSRYDRRGVSASKSEVHDAIQGLDKGLFPNAFCKILPDVVAGDPDYCNIMHADTAGTKTSLAYIYWKETGDLSVWKGVVQDSIVMNLDDMACVGCVDDIILSSTIGRNKSLIPGEVIKEVIQGAQAFIENMGNMGVRILSAGGETADVGDIVRTIDIGFTAFARMKRSEVINIDIQEGDFIVGFASYGKAIYEENYNGGMGSNGLTSARHDVFNKVYQAKYPDSFDSNIPSDVIYTGPHKLTDSVEVEGEEITAGKLVLSPTRTYLPILKRIIENHRKDLNGLIHCTGGAQTKVMKFVDKNLHIIKNRLMDEPPLFKLIRESSGVSWKEMYEVFNMGHRLEAYVPSREVADSLIEISESYGVKAQIIGQVQRSDSPQLTIDNGIEIIQY
ncbi:MAG: phosphoribosylformylglycinamidine cyclo-ligase [Saprospiraceae bacterium]|nr:phosphoribosylformylglycinamidine cyclo-ligase [Saprospiraceae bacterium]